MKTKRSPFLQTISSSRAFTLIEVLVTAGIVVVLAALTTQAVQNSQGTARQAQKVANLRSIGAAHGIYIAENDGRCLPANLDNVTDDPALAGSTRAWWPYYIQRYANSEVRMFHNPDFRRPDGSRQPIWDDVANPSSGRTVDEQPGEFCRIEAGFGWNWYQSSITPGDQGDWVINPNEPRGSAAVSAPSRLIVCMESMSVIAGPNPSVGLNFEAWISSVRVDPNFWAGPRWSKGAISCLFFDGHVAQMKPDDFKVENFSPIY